MHMLRIQCTHMHWTLCNVLPRKPEHVLTTI